MDTTIERFAVDDARRHEGIGGSEVGAALGVNPYMSPVELYLLKRGEIKQADCGDAADLGHILEPWILDQYEKRERIKLERPGNRVFRHKELSFLFAHIDGDAPSKRLGVDAKSTGIMNLRAGQGYGEDGTDQVPLSVIGQCVQYMAIRNYERWDVAALKAGYGLKFYQINRDESLEKDILQRLKSFWYDHVLAGIPPKPESVNDVDLLYRFGDLDPIEVKPHIFKAYKQLLEIRNKIKSLNGRKADLELEIKEFIGDHNALVNIAGDPLITWKKDDDSTIFDLEAFKSDYPELYEEYQKDKTGCRRFLVKDLAN